MSATGRSDVRQKDDFYATPIWATQAILPHLGEPRTVLDPCAGDGAILRVVRDHWRRADVRGIELDPERAVRSSSRCGDALNGAGWGHPDMVITNPPYKLAMPFVERALASARVVVMLLRLNWLAGQRRADFHRKHPADVYVLSRRPSFTGNGTDSTEYAWFVWSAGRGGAWSVV